MRAIVEESSSETSARDEEQTSHELQCRFRSQVETVEIFLQVSSPPTALTTTCTFVP